MAFKEAKEQMSTLIRWTPEPKDAEDKSIFLGNVITGYYKDKKEDVGQNKSNIYEIQLADGNLIGMWGSGLLDGKFDEIPQGCLVRITYLGIAQPKKVGGRAYQNFTVEFDPDQKIPANFQPVVAAPAPVAAPVAAPAATAPAFPGSAFPSAPSNAGY